jgi:hypothetical protein
MHLGITSWRHVKPSMVFNEVMRGIPAVQGGRNRIGLAGSLLLLDDFPGCPSQNAAKYDGTANGRGEVSADTAGELFSAGNALRHP